MKFTAVVKKEIRAIQSQRISILLIILYPLLGTLLFGLAMTGLDFTTASNLNVGITGTNSSLISELSDNDNYNFLEYETVFDLKDAVSKKQVIAGLELIENQGDKSTVNIYYDNSSITSSRFFTNLIKTNIENISKEQTLTAISEILKTTNLLSTNINDEIEKLDEFKENLEVSGVMLDNLEIKINSFDINDLENDINEQKTNISVFREKNEKLKAVLLSVRTEFDNLKTIVNQINSSIDQYSFQLEQIENEIDNQEDNINDVISELDNLKSQIPNSIKDEYQEQIDQLEIIYLYLVNWKVSITNINNLIESTNNSQNNLNMLVNNFETTLVELETESSEIDAALNSSEDGISNLEEKMVLFEETLIQARELISESRKSKTDIEEKINQSKELFDELLPKIESFKDMDPALLIEPIEVKLVPTEVNSKLTWHLIDIDATQLGVMIANSISIILILTCILLTGIVILSEKNQEIPLRLFMSEANQFTLTMGKLFGQLLIALIETIIIILLAIFVFGFPLSINYLALFLAVILVSASFISIGLVIGAYTKNQSTTILLSLLLIIPMLFVSGIIIPLELMPGFISAFAGFLPLTAANNLLIGVIVKSGGIYFIWKEVIVLSAITLIGIILYIMKRQ